MMLKSVQFAHVSMLLTVKVFCCPGWISATTVCPVWSSPPPSVRNPTVIRALSTSLLVFNTCPTTWYIAIVGFVSCADTTCNLPSGDVAITSSEVEVVEVEVVDKLLVDVVAVFVCVLVIVDVTVDITVIVDPWAVCVIVADLVEVVVSITVVVIGSA